MEKRVGVGFNPIRKTNPILHFRFPIWATNSLKKSQKDGFYFLFLIGYVFVKEMVHQTNMDYRSILISLYYLFIHADGKVNATEMEMGEQMAHLEGIDSFLHASEMERAKKKDPALLHKECMNALRKQSRQNQVKCVAWLCVVANADGFMDRSEWQFIYGVYHKELQLTLDEVMAMQKELLLKVRQTTKVGVAIL